MADRYSFTFLRDPVERVLSLYAYALSRPDGEWPIFDDAKKAGLEGFLRDHRFRRHVWNNQVWQLSYGWYAWLVGLEKKQVEDFTSEDLLDRARSNLARFNYVGFVDTIGVDAVAIFRELGWDAPEVPHANASPRGLMSADLSDSHLALLHEVTELDRRLFEYAKRAYA